jgi:hypothetical protein
MPKACSLFCLLVIAFLVFSTIVACRPSGSSEDFGTVIIEVPEVPGAEEPYVIPELGPSTSDVRESAKTKPSADTAPAKPDEETGASQAQPPATPG